MKRIILYLFAAIIFSGCNNSAKQQAEQQAREKFIVDSVTQSIKAKQNLEDEKKSLASRIDSLENQKIQLQKKNSRLKADLTAANDNLRSVSEFHLLRSSSERQVDIRLASLRVNELQQAISNNRDEYTELEENLATAKGKLANR